MGREVLVTAFLVLFSTDIVDICESFVRVNDEQISASNPGIK